MTGLDFTYLPKGESIGHMTAHRTAGYVPSAIHMHDHAEIVLVTSFCVFRVVNSGREFLVQAPALLHHRAGTFHEIVAVTEGTLEAQVIFYHPQLFFDIPDTLLPKNQILSHDFWGISLSPAQTQTFLTLFSILCQRHLHRKLLPLLSILEQAALEQEAGTVSITGDAGQTYIFHVAEYLQSTVGEKHTIAALAERFHVSQTKLKADFKKITGVSVKTFEIRTRLQKALTLLSSTRMEQAAIANTCGYTDESHFIESFRSVFGMTPGVWRKKQQSSQT